MNEIAQLNHANYSKGIAYLSGTTLRSDHKHRIDEIVNFIDNYAKGRKNISVLDLACYDGFVCERLKSIGLRKFYGVDIVPEAVTAAKDRGITALVADVAKPLPFEKDSMDVVIAGEIIEHLYRPEELIRNARRVLKKNGAFILTIPNICSLRNKLRIFCGRFPHHYASSSEERFGTHIRLFNKQKIETILSEEGFGNIKFSSNGIYGAGLCKRTCPSLGDILVVCAKKEV
jgi:SAM-dependent methyltransferase